MSVYEQVQQSLTKAQKQGGKTGLNCIAELDPTAIQQAKELDARGKTEIPDFWGTPVLIKDNIDVKGLHTTAGSLALDDNIAAEDAPVIRNLRKNGAVILGKANMTEFANYTTNGMPGGYSSRGGQYYTENRSQYCKPEDGISGTEPVPETRNKAAEKKWRKYQQD